MGLVLLQQRDHIDRCGANKPMNNDLFLTPDDALSATCFPSNDRAFKGATGSAASQKPNAKRYPGE